MDTPTETLNKKAGPYGRQLAEQLAEKVCDAIDGYPASSAAQLWAIYQLMAARLLSHSENYGELPAELEELARLGEPPARPTDDPRYMSGAH